MRKIKENKQQVNLFRKISLQMFCFYSCIKNFFLPIRRKLNLRFCWKERKERNETKRKDKERKKSEENRTKKSAQKWKKIIKKRWKRTRFLIRRRYNIYSVSPGMRLLLSLLSSHSSMLMLNFQNFYITKGPTTSAGEKPRQVHNPSQGAARCSGERHARALCTDTDSDRPRFRQFFRRIFFVCSLSFLFSFLPSLLSLIRARRARIIRGVLSEARECQPPFRDWFMMRRYFYFCQKKIHWLKKKKSEDFILFIY